MSDETDFTPVEDDQPEPEQELAPMPDEGDDVTDDEMEEPRGLPKTSFVGDDQDVHGRDDHPQDSPPVPAPDMSPPDTQQESEE